MGVQQFQVLKSALRRFLRDDGGDAAVQYALMASLVSAFLIGAYLTLGEAQSVAYTQWSTAVTEANDGGEE
jgi:Flp pilus assembly pilin Flp